MPTTTFDAHQAWLNAMHLAYEAHLAAKHEDGSRPVGSSSFSASTALPLAPGAVWDTPDPRLPTYRGGGSGFSSSDAGLDGPFGALALGNDIVDIDDVPVYRSGFANIEFVDAPEVYQDDGPVYRSLSSAFAASEHESSFVEPINAIAPESSNPAQEPLDSLWLQTMPPLIRRQTGGNLA